MDKDLFSPPLDEGDDSKDVAAVLIAVLVITACFFVLWHVIADVVLS